jgi:leucyl-tRNA synthetase
MLVNYAYKDQRGALVPVDEVEQSASGTYVKIKTQETVEKITAKMSKSLRNVINPDDVIKEYGADTLRMFLMFLGPLESMKPWDSQAITGVSRFIKKVWNYVHNLVESGLASIGHPDQAEVDKILAQTIKKVGESTNDIRFNTAIAALMEAINGLSNKVMNIKQVEDFLVLLSPYAPHVSEELWEVIGQEKSISSAPWPSYDPKLLIEDSVNVVIQIQGKKRSMINVPLEITQELLKQKVIEEMQGTQYQLTEADKFITIYEKGTKTPKLVNVIPIA